MAILDLLRRKRQEEDGEEEDVEEAEGADEEAEDETGGAGLLDRLNVVVRLVRMFRRDGVDDDEDSDAGADAGEANDDAEEGESGTGFLSRWFSLLSGLGGVLRGILRRGGGEDEDEEEDDAPLPVAAALAQEPEDQGTGGPEDIGPETEDTDDATSPQGGTGDQAEQPVADVGGAPETGENAAGPGKEDVKAEMSPTARRLRELAQSQDDVPIEELADDLQKLVELLGGRRR